MKFKRITTTVKFLKHQVSEHAVKLPKKGVKYIFECAKIGSRIVPWMIILPAVLVHDTLKEAWIASGEDEGEDV